MTHLTNDPYGAFKSARYFSGLDALRALSVIAVIWSHVGGYHGGGLLGEGRRGVDLFFAISGFLVTTLLVRERDRTGRVSLQDFYVRRTLRIFPLYYAILALYCIVVFLTLQDTVKGAEFWTNLPYFITYTSNWFVDPAAAGDRGATFYFAWSLATEEQFYLFWPPLMVLLLKATGRTWTLPVAALLLLALKVAMTPFDGTSLPATIVASLSPAILFGVAFALVLNNRRAFNQFYPALGSPVAAPVAALVLLLLLQFDGNWLAVRLAMAVLVASLCVREDTWLHPVLTWRSLGYLGTISYGIYLMHMLAANAARLVLHHQSGMDVFIATTLGAAVAASLSFRFFEAPLLRLKSRFTGHRPDTERVPARDSAQA